MLNLPEQRRIQRKQVGCVDKMWELVTSTIPVPGRGDHGSADNQKLQFQWHETSAFMGKLQTDWIFHKK